MINSPFTVFKQFADRFSVVLITKEDDVHADAELAAMLGSDRIASLHQMHGNRTIVVSEATSRSEQADGLVTSTPDLWLSTRSADCQSLVVYAPEQNVCGVLHAGWKGVLADAVGAFFKTLKGNFDIDGHDTYVGIGPSLCQKCADFTDPTRELPVLPAKFIHDKHVDLQGAATAQLITCGVPENHIERLPDCTRCMPEEYWTYRGGDREKVKEGYTNIVACRLL